MEGMEREVLRCDMSLGRESDGRSDVVQNELMDRP